MSTRTHPCVRLFCIVDALTSASLLPGIGGYFAQDIERRRPRRSRPRGQYVKVLSLERGGAFLGHINSQETEHWVHRGESVLGQRRARVINPLLNALPTPLMVGVVHEPLRYGIAVRHQSLQHHRKIHVGNRPLPEYRIAAPIE